MSGTSAEVDVFVAVLNEQTLFKSEQTEGNIRWQIAFCQKRAPDRRFAFRASRFAVLEHGLPFIAQLVPAASQPQVVSTIAWLIAI
jgi:hypothetical protein